MQQEKLIEMGVIFMDTNLYLESLLMKEKGNIYKIENNHHLLRTKKGDYYDLLIENNQFQQVSTLDNLSKAGIKRRQQIINMHKFDDN